MHCLSLQKSQKPLEKAFVNTQVPCNIICKALGTKCHGSPEEIINNFPTCVKKPYFIWMFKTEKELLSRKKKWRKAVKPKGAACIKSFRTVQGPGVFTE